MNRFIVAVLCLICLTACGQPASGAILVMSPNGTYTTKATLSAAATDADAAGKTVVVTSALSAVQSNISSATLHAWPSDRTLRREKGGTIGNTTLFRFADGAEVDFPGQDRVFAGTGRVLGLGRVSVEWFGEDATAMNLAFASAKKISFYPGKSYQIASAVIGDHDIEIEGNGATISSTNANGYVDLYGSIGATIPITATIRPGQKTITATNSFSVGDLVVIRDNTDNSFSNHRTYYKKGEAHLVQSATGSTFDIPAARNSYQSLTNLTVVKITPITVKIKNLTVVNESATDFVLRVQFGKNNIFEGLKVTGGVNRAFVLDRCYISTADNCEFINRSDPTPGLNYGIAISASHYTTIRNSILHGTRHATGLGGGNLSGDVPCYNTDINGGTLTNDPTTDLYVADIHGDAVNTTYRNATIYGAIALGGENAYYLNNKIHSTADLPPVQLQEIVGGEFILENNTIDVYGWPSPPTYDYCVGFTSSATSDDVDYDFNLTLRSNTFGLNSDVASVVRWFNNTVTATWNIDMGNTSYRGDGSGLTAVIDFNNSSGKVPVWIKLHDFNTHSTMTVSSVELFNVASGSATGCRLTLPSADHDLSIAVTNTDHSVSAASTFAFNYGTVVPRVSATIQDNSITSSGYQYASVSSVTATGATITATTGEVAVTFGTSRSFAVNVHTDLADYAIP